MLVHSAALGELEHSLSRQGKCPILNYSLPNSNAPSSLTVSMRISDDEFTATWETFRLMFLDTHTLALWLIPLSLAVLLRLITHKFHHQLIFPLCWFQSFPQFF